MRDHPHFFGCKDDKFNVNASLLTPYCQRSSTNGGRTAVNRRTVSLKAVFAGLLLLFSSNHHLLAEEEATLAPFFQQHCMSCHGPEKEKGGLRIDQLSGSLYDFESLDHLQNILDEITVGSMPPEEEPRPSDGELAQAVSLLRGHLKKASDLNKSSGDRPVRRLTKIEYINTVYDLLGVNIVAGSLPDDGTIGVFDTDAQALYTTDMYFENYLEVARGAVGHFIDSRRVRPEKAKEVTKKPEKNKEKGKGKKKDEGEPESGKIQILNASEGSFQSYQFFQSILSRYSNSNPPDDAAIPIIKKFMLLMNRGHEVDQVLVDGLQEQFLMSRKRGESFWEAIIEPMALSMCTMEAMFHFENKDPDGARRDVSAIELANRLSYFLWRSAPDMELFRLARSGQINDPKIRSKKIDSMMKDAKFDRFIRDFTNQWLELERQDVVAVDELLFKDFDNSIKSAIKEETVQFMSHVIKKNLPIGNMVDSKFVLVNDVMAKYYGMPKVNGSDFRVVKLPAQSRRGGVLTQAGILMQTGTGERSSIVERGVFISKKILSSEPPPPPPLIADLPTEGTDFKRMTGAELVRKHASSVQCSSCHNKIDPLGLGLEEFDAIGLYRTKDVRIDPDFHKQKKAARKSLKNLTFEVDLETKGRLFTGESFQGSEGLKKALLTKQYRLAQSYIEALLSFANGRKVGIAERTFVEDLVKQAEKGHYPALAILKEVVELTAVNPN